MTHEDDVQSDAVQSWSTCEVVWYHKFGRTHLTDFNRPVALVAHGLIVSITILQPWGASSQTKQYLPHIFSLSS